MELSTKGPKQVEVIRSTLNCLINLHGVTQLGPNRFFYMFTSAKRRLILDVIPNANLEIGNQWMVANIVALENAILFQISFMFCLHWNGFVKGLAYTCSFGIEMVM